ncbi:hypothetical protein V2J09_002291 [Rumex salicifolius]
MKGPLDRTKVVLRHLPPSISKAMLTDQIDPKFSGRYNWLSFFPGNSSQKRVVHSRAYVNFNKAEDVIEFAEFFNGHVFVNEKGAQYKAVVEYAPSQSFPKQWSKRDGRQGTIFKDPEYVEFLEFLGKPVEHLPSAEIQLERREAEQAAAGKDALIITPLMHYIRQKRAANSGSRRSLNNGKSVRRIGRRSSDSSRSVSSKQSERRRVSTTMYVVRDATKASKGKDKSSDSLISKREHQKCSDKTALTGVSHGDEVSIDENGTADVGKKKIMLLKGKDWELAHVKLPSSGSIRPNVRRETGGKIIKSILQPDRLIQSSQVERDRQSQPSNICILSKSRNASLDDEISGSDRKAADKSERRTRNKDRPDRGVWTPLRKSDGLHGSNDSLSSASQSMQMPSPSAEGSSVHLSRRRLPQGRKDGDVSIQEGKSARRTTPSGYNSNEKQVWIQKPNATRGAQKGRTD